jgi:tellurite resistance protein
MPLAAIEAKIATLEKQAQRVGVELQMWRSALGLHQGRQAGEELRQREPLAAGIEAVAAVSATASVTSNDTKPTLRQAVLNVVGSQPNRRWATKQIRQQLVEAGWLAESDVASTHLYSMLSNMATKGQIKRPETGFYTVA